MTLEGVFVAQITPFDENLNLDKKALISHLHFLQEAGVHGFVPCGTTGESATLSPEERAVIIDTSLEIAKTSRLKTIVGCGGNDTQKVLSLILDAKSRGADAALVVTPYYNKPNQRGLLAHFEYLAKKTQFPLVLYNVPSRTHVNIEPQTALTLFKNPYIVGIKEASGQFGQWLHLSAEANLDRVSLLAGDDDALFPILSLGGTGIISAGANLIPKHFVQIYESFRKGQFEEAAQKQKAIRKTVAAIFAETNPSPVKYGLSLTRGLNPAARLPLVPIGDATQTVVKAALKELEVLS